MLLLGGQKFGLVTWMILYRAEIVYISGSSVRVRGLVLSILN